MCDTERETADVKGFGQGVFTGKPFKPDFGIDFVDEDFSRLDDEGISLRNGIHAGGAKDENAKQETAIRGGTGEIFGRLTKTVATRTTMPRVGQF